MHFAALAADYDGTLAHHGVVPPEAVDALKWAKARGKKLILVTGRELPELQRLFPELGLFDMVVAENGALLFCPGDGSAKQLASAPPTELVDRLKAGGAHPLSVGTTVVATWEPHQQLALDCIRDLGLEWQIVFNKGAVMCLPTGVNKATGLAAALLAMGLSPLNVVAIGDAENDHAFLRLCGFSCAVANAIDAVKAEVDMVTQADHGAGVCELIQAWVGEGARGFGAPMERHGVAFGDYEEGAAALLHPSFGATLIAGSSGAGKSHTATALLEAMNEAKHQFVVLDPEGDYDALDGATHLGAPDRAPTVEEAEQVLARPDVSLVLNLLGVDLTDRATFLQHMLKSLSPMRAERGRPHWVLVDETHHFLPSGMEDSAASLPQPLPGFVFITVEPQELAPAALQAIESAILVGPKAAETLKQICALLGEEAPRTEAPDDEQVLFWRRGAREAPRLVRVRQPLQDHKRHVRKYAEGKLSEDKSFYFRGPEKKLKSARGEPDHVRRDCRGTRRRNLGAPFAPGRLFTLGARRHRRRRLGARDRRDRTRRRRRHARGGRGSDHAPIHNAGDELSA